MIGPCTFPERCRCGARFHMNQIDENLDKTEEEITSLESTFGESRTTMTTEAPIDRATLERVTPYTLTPTIWEIQKYQIYKMAKYQLSSMHQENVKYSGLLQFLGHLRLWGSIRSVTK